MLLLLLHMVRVLLLRVVLLLRKVRLPLPPCLQVVDRGALAKALLLGHMLDVLVRLPLAAAVWVG